MESEFNPFSEESNSRQSVRTSPPGDFNTPRPDPSNQENDNPISLEVFSTPPQTACKPRGRPKGSKNIKWVFFDPEAIGQRTRTNLQKENYDDDGDYLKPVVNDAVFFSCSTGYASQESKSPSDFLKHWTFHKECQLPSRQNFCECS